MSYLYGTAYHDSIRINSMDVLFVDYDQGVIGTSVNAAYRGLSSKGFPTIHQLPTSEYPTPNDVRQAVCKGQYWGAIYANTNASSKLSSAFASPQAAELYNNTEALTYVWNGAKYAAYAETIYSSLEILVQATRGAYYQINGTAVMSNVNITDTMIAQTVLDPISASSINIKPTNQGVRFYYNTVSMVMPILQQFFFIMALNGISSEFRIFRLLSLKMGILLRFGLSICYTFIASLCMTSYIWGFREDWDIDGGQFALTWMAIWLVMHLNFLLIDPVTAVLPTKFMPFAILTWIIINVSSSLSPFELSAGFYRIGYALPAYELYQLLLDIWTDGCNPPLYRTLPILFAWWLIGFVAFLFGMRKRHSQELSMYTDNGLSKMHSPLGSAESFS
ncbi:uncharacterized protein N7469_002111 [Penicillium citrinum]|uniref:DUF3533 domain-containing protein n=1 Tax=Penicillium citrinum TaxID=5077 RepID=A0A9W9TT74_PENCI|nr:uncharacterized protein N7469_002111 [Penicillium citrinum]KAJ5240520.1 hypothetical protein N7469_002111 [Penicillium citrinum]